MRQEPQLPLNLMGAAGMPKAIAQVHVKEVPVRQEAPKGINMAMRLAYLPFITKECHAHSMNNFRRFVAFYNAAVRDTNMATRKHNSAVRAHLQTIQDPVVHRYIALFEERSEELGVWEYNQAAMEACSKYGLIITLKKVQTVKPATEQYFSLFLYEYSTQVNDSTNRRIKYYPTKTLRPLPPMDLNSRSITRIKRPELCADGEPDVYSLPVCKDSVINHRNRLQEAGILINYCFRGSYRGVHVQINPHILVFFDAETEKLTGTVNQYIANDRAEVFNNVLVSTRPSKRVEKSKPGKPICVDKVSAEPTAFTLQEQPRGDIYQITRFCRIEKSSPGGAAEMLNVEENKHSAALKDLIIDPDELCQGLASGKYDDYKPLDQVVFDIEAFKNGTLTNEEFVTVWVQNFLKLTAARLYRGRRDNYPGAWYNTYTHLITQLSKNGKYQSKYNMATWYPEYTWRIGWAAKWFERESRKAKKLISPDHPSRYFNVYRKGRACVGFAYTGQKWKERELKADPEKKLKLQADKEALKIKARSSDTRKFEAKIQDHFIGKITMDQLFDYLDKNLPQQYMVKAMEAISKRAEKIGLKISFA